MKLTILYDKKDIGFLLQFSPISEEYFIEQTGYDIAADWEPGSDSGFSEKLSNSENILIVLSENTVNCKWIVYVLGYASGKNLNCHIYSLNQVLPSWNSVFTISNSIEDLIEYYKFFNSRWFETAAIKIAKKTLIDLYQDITLTAFVEVVKEGDCLLAGIYLDAGYKPTDTDKKGVPLICWAARMRKLAMIKLLMQAGADINAVSGDRNDTALIDAVSEDDYEIVSFILNYSPDLEIKSKNGQTALIIASGHNNADIVRLLVEHGASDNTTDKLGMSAIAYARLQNNSEIIELLSREE